MNDCARILDMLPQFVDGDLAAEESAWLGAHLEACADCRAAAALFTEIDGELTGWGQRLGAEDPPTADAREQLEARLAALPPRHGAMRWMPAAAAAAIAATLILAAVAPRKQPPAPAPNRELAAAFVEIPYLPPLDPRENVRIVRMDIRVAALIAAGYRVAADPETIVPADVLVGEDGRAHAVRVLSGIEWNGTGD